MQADCLHKIEQRDIDNLLNLLKQDLPRSTVVYHWILVQRKWSENIAGVVVNILCPAGDWRTGTVVAFTQGLALNEKVYGVVYARAGNESQLSHVLHTTRVIPWRHVLHFSGVLEVHVSAVTRAATSAGIVLPKQQMPCHLILFDEDQTVQFRDLEVPERIGRVLIRQLRGTDLGQVWGMRAVFSNNYMPVIRACLEHNMTAGVFEIQSDGTEKLVSMVLQTPYGGLGMGATHPDYLHQGYNSVAHGLILHLMSNSHFQIHGHVMVDNEVAMNFFSKNGVKIVGKTQRVDIVPGEYTYFYFKPHL